MIRLVTVGRRRVEYTLVQAKNRTTLLLQALPEEKIRLYAPRGYSLREADRLVAEKLPEIDRAHRSMASARPALPGTLPYEGRMLPVEVKKAPKTQVLADGNKITVLLPSGRAEDAAAALKAWLVKRALEKIRCELDVWAPTVGKSYGRVTIREQRTRWGSCSAKHNLNFNWKLIMAPPECLKYVVIHELCHLLYFNHSALFWAEVGRRMPDYGIWRRWLKKHGSELTLSPGGASGGA
ncbi:MAG: M48 family metallopeptidase [Clostridia bacterium]|nr:M48 family metallopeptidase [Clostridia bacterium]